MADAAILATLEVAALRRVPALARLGLVSEVFPLGLGLREDVQAAIGVDVALDLDRVSVFARRPEGGGDEWLVVARGRFPDDVVARVAAGIGGSVETVSDRPLLRAKKGSLVLASAPDGAVLAGTPALVEPRLSNDWKPGRRPAGALTVPAGLVGLAASTQWLRQDGGRLATDLAGGFTHASLSIDDTGLEWTLGAKDLAHLERARLASEGLLALLRAGHPAARGAARVIAAVAESFLGADTVADAAISRAAELLSLVDALSGDGTFESTLDVNKRTKRVTARAQGAALTDVVAAGGVVPLLGLLGAFRRVAERAR